jgi:hypothetical protein
VDFPHATPPAAAVPADDYEAGIGSAAEVPMRAKFEKRRRMDRAAKQPSALRWIALAIAAIAVLSIGVGLGSIVSAPTGNSGLQPQYIPGDYITFQCTDSKIVAGGTTVCNNQASNTVDMCDVTQCVYSTSDSPLSGYSFSKWTASSDAFFGVVSSTQCGSSQSSTANPVSLCMIVASPGGRYGGVLTATVT